MDKQKFAFDKTNFILLAIGMAIVIVGFLLMTGPSSTETAFEPDIFPAADWIVENPPECIRITTERSFRTGIRTFSERPEIQNFRSAACSFR